MDIITSDTAAYGDENNTAMADINSSPSAATKTTATQRNAANANCRLMKQLLDSQALVDCTLACANGSISAHRFVLARCSNYLDRLLGAHHSQHPLIVLPNVDVAELHALVNYMYTGELRLADDAPSAGLTCAARVLNVNSLLDFALAASEPQVAQSDSIGGLQINEPMAAALSAIAAAAATAGGAVGIQQFGQHLHHQHHQPDGQLPSAAVSGRPSTGSNRSLSGDSTCSPSSSTITSRASSACAKSHELPAQASSRFSCPICQNDFFSICSFEYHMQRAHQVNSFNCDVCHKKFASLRYVLTDHMRRCHS